MKKRILALLLAGLITASFASCISSSNRPENPTGTETEETQTRVEETTEDITVTWQDDAATVYVTAASLTLMPINEDDSSMKVERMTELKRLQVSSDGKRSIVEVDGIKYYASNASLSEDDLLGKKFEAFEKTMYATSGVQIRPYASTSNEFSKGVGSLAKGDAVTVVSKGSSEDITWCKIKVVDEDTNKESFYFVSAKYLSEDPNGETPSVDYSEHFEDCTEPFSMYVKAGKNLNLRSEPIMEDNTLKTLTEKTEVVVLKIGKGDCEGWYYVRVADEKVAGLPQTYTEGYISSSMSYLDYTDGSLEQLMAYYGFTAEEKTLYTTSGLNVRSTPAFPGENETSNVVEPPLQFKDAVKVVAVGTVDGVQWCIIEREEGADENKQTVYRFVSASYLTTDPNGEPVATLESMLAANKEFTAVEAEYKVYATEKTYGFVALGATTPSVTDAKLTVEAGTELTVVATGTKYNMNMLIVKDGNGAFYFVYAEFFTTNAPVVG